MAVTFRELLNRNADTCLIDGVRTAYIDCRVMRNTVPESVHVYEVRDTTDDGGCYIGNVEDSVFVNHSGTMFSAAPLKMRHPDWGGVYIDLSDDVEPWEWETEPVTLKEFFEQEGIAIPEEEINEE